jgi:hypothetical protein
MSGPKSIAVDRLKQAPICLDSNKISQNAIDPALNQKMITLFFESKDRIKNNPEWVTVRNKLTRYIPFNMVYEFTKDWNDKIITDRFFKEMEKEFDFKNLENDLDRAQAYISIITLGRYLYWNIFGIELTYSENIIKLLVESRQKTQRDISNQFIEYIMKAKNYNPNAYNKSWLHPLLRQKRETSDYFFSQECLSGFKIFTKRDDLDLNGLAQLVNDGLAKDKKEMFSYCSFKIDGNTLWGIRIRKWFFHEENDEKEELRLGLEDFIGRK